MLYSALRHLSASGVPPWRLAGDAILVERHGNGSVPEANQHCILQLFCYHALPWLCTLAGHCSYESAPAATLRTAAWGRSPAYTIDRASRHDVHASRHVKRL